MNQENIGKLIKDLRIKSSLTQQQFADKYGVTYQAVSKWENGKNIPDLAILKNICEDYNINLDELLNGKQSKKISKKTLFFIIICIFIIFILIGSTIYLISKHNKDKDFEFKTIQTTCDNFNLYGSIAYSSNKTSIYISNITYCGKEDNNLYTSIECSLYEQSGDIKTKINSYFYDEKEILLNDFLNKVNFNVDHYSNTCQMYKENGLYLEIEATKKENDIVYYKIPLKLEDNCN